MLQFPKRLRLDLADTFTLHAELLADFFQRVIGVHADAEAHAQHTLLTRRKRCQHASHSFLEVRLYGRVDWNDRVLALNEVAQMGIFITADRPFTAYRLLGDLHKIGK